MRLFHIVATIALCLASNGALSQSQVDLRPIDECLELWNRFAEGENALTSRITEAWPKANQSLVRALDAKDKRAPSRAVFLMLVQVGNSMPVDSTTGQAWRRYAGDAFPVSEVNGRKVYQPWHFYDWWIRNRSPMHDLPLLTKWTERDFGKKTVIPFYRKMLEAGR